jgi:RimJ/RimL family protein N-acetyltransferase
MESPQVVCDGCAEDAAILTMRDLSRQAFPPRFIVVCRRQGERHARICAMKDAAPDRRYRFNEFGQPVGFDVPGWTSPPFPPHVALSGRYCRLEPYRADTHARDIFEAQAEDRDGTRWTYSFDGPFADFAAYAEWARRAEASRDPQFYAIVDAQGGRASGSCSNMRIEPKHGVIEVGNIYFAPRLAHTRAATEAMFLLMQKAFALGYRRYEWKCDSCNLPSRLAATRFGFTYEGTFRQAIVNKGRNRDTTWFAIVDVDWKRGLEDAYLRWLDPSNFDATGKQRLRLSELTAPYVQRDSADAIPPLEKR